MKRIFSIFSFLVLTASYSQTPLPKNWDLERDKHTLRIAFYNVENLFDTIDDLGKIDEEYLPSSEKEWNSGKYRSKLNNTSKVITALGGWQSPDLIGLCEIENAGVVEDLCQSEALKKNDYRFVHFESPDKRGIDVALIYKSKNFKPLYSKALHVFLEEDSSFYTRDILYVKGMYEKEALHIFVNHWPSRRGGAEQSEHKRIRAAQVLKATTDSIQNENPESKIVIMGDFNDTPKNKSIDETLDAGAHSPPSTFVNLMRSLPEHSGTHKYRGEWAYLDQFIVSKTAYDKLSLGPIVFWQEWMVKEDNKYPGYYPKRSWSGNFYNYGYSDHLPIFIDIDLSKTK